MIQNPVNVFSRANRVLGALFGPSLIKLERIDASRARRLFPLSMELKLYSREWCSWCIDAKEYLEARGYNFTAIDVGEDREAYEEMKQLSEQTYVPTFVAGEHVIANFDTDQLEKFLTEHQINP